MKYQLMGYKQVFKRDHIGSHCSRFVVLTRQRLFDLCTMSNFLFGNSGHNMNKW